jgi:hypothetical protein
MRRESRVLFAVTLGVCAQHGFASGANAGSNDELVARHAAANGVPERLVQRVIRTESRGNARAVSAGNYGLMQIRLGTARSVGYHGDATGLLDADTNLTYAVKYLAGAYRAAGCNEDRAVSYYMRGYYGASPRGCSSAWPTDEPQAELKVAKRIKREEAKAKSTNAEATEPADVIKPKLVRTETIAAPKSKPELAPARPIGAFEPKRVAPPPVRPVEATKAASAGASSTDLASADKTDRLKPTAVQSEPEPVPLPPERHELDTSPQHEAVLHSRRVHSHGGRRARAAADEPSGVVTFLKKLVASDEKRPRKRRRQEANGDRSSQIPPPM